MRHLDLFSGIGGFSIAARSVGWPTIGLCEVDPFCVRVLQRRVDCDRWFSLPGFVDSGKAAGIERIEELAGVAPDWLVIENVYHTWRRWMPELRRRLWSLGYASVPLRVRASDVGAVHRRSRGWLVANTHGFNIRLLSWWWSREGGAVAQKLAEPWDSAPERLGADDGLSEELDESRRHALGNAVVPRAAELIFCGIEFVNRYGSSGNQST